jgi:Ca2+/Na+ antiporter
MNGTRWLTFEQRRGAILFALLLGPAPVALFLFLAGTSTAVVAAVLGAVAVLVAVMIGLLVVQRRVGTERGLRVLPGIQITALLVLIAAIAGSVFLLPDARFTRWGLLCVTVAIGIVYVMGFSIRRRLDDLDERSIVLVLGLMALLVALANAGV